MRRGVYVLHLTADEVETLSEMLNADSPLMSDRIEAIRAKVNALQDIVKATTNIHEASERYKQITGYYDGVSKVTYS